MSCVKLVVWSIVAQKGTDILIFYISEYVAEGSRTIASEENCPPDDCPPGNCLPDSCPRGKLPPRKIAPQTNALEDNCPLGKLPPAKLLLHHKISSENNFPRSSEINTSELRKTMHCLRVLLSMIKESFYQKIIFKAANQD